MAAVFAATAIVVFAGSAATQKFSVGGRRANTKLLRCVSAKPISIASVPLKLKPIFFGIYAAHLLSYSDRFAQFLCVRYMKYSPCAAKTCSDGSCAKIDCHR